MGNFDLILEKIGPYGRFQRFNYVMTNLIIISGGIQSLLNVYLQATPEHWCHVPELANGSTGVQTEIPGPSSELRGRDTSCFVVDHDYTEARDGYSQNDTAQGNTSVVPCQNWDYDHTTYGTTAVTKWDLVCGKSTFPAMAQSIYMVGFLVGAFVLGYVSDRFGRRTALLTSLLSTIIFGTLSALMPEIWSHLICRMFAGMGAFGTMTVGFLMGVEPIGIKHRIFPGCCSQAFFAVGYMLLAGIAYLMRDFMWTNFTMSLIPTALLCCFWFIPESPRWLMAEGRTAEAKIVLTRAAKLNGVSVDIDELIEQYTVLDGKAQPEGERKYTIVDLLRTPNMRRKTLLISYNWFVITMVYYGLTMGVTDIAGDPYINLFISGVCECAAVIITGLVLDRVGRRLCLAVVMTAAGLGCVVCGMLRSEYAIASSISSMVGKFGVSCAFAIIYIFTAELNPTVVRTVGVGAGSMSGRIGGLIAPFIAELRRVWGPLPTIVFGILAMSSGVLSLLLPETVGHKLPETLEEGERFGRNTKFWRCQDKLKNNQNDDTVA